MGVLTFDDPVAIVHLESTMIDLVIVTASETLIAIAVQRYFKELPGVLYCTYPLTLPSHTCAFNLV